MSSSGDGAAEVTGRVVHRCGVQGGPDGGGEAVGGDQRRERARVRSECRHRWGRPKAA